MGKLNRAEYIGGKFQNPVPTSVGNWRMMIQILWLYLTNKAERTPKKTLGPFTTDPRAFHQSPASGLRITWMGHSSMLMEIDGARVLIDPVWDQRAGPFSWAGPKRFFPPTLPLEQLPAIDVILLSHDHYDHLGIQTVKQLARLPAASQARWVVPLQVGAILKGWGVPSASITELDWTQSTYVAGLEITALPARHFSGRSLFNRFETLWASFVLAGPRHRVYYGADSGEWPGFAEIAQNYGPFNLTMLEIGAFDPLWADIHMGPEGAIRTFRAMGAKGLLMPIHWALFDLALHAWRQPIERIFVEPDLRLWSPQPGLPSEVVSDTELRSSWWRSS
jgi:L-ascorbate metabolism protein UlaG (beta-lactamase superfamily)